MLAPRAGADAAVPRQTRCCSSAGSLEPLRRRLHSRVGGRRRRRPPTLAPAASPGAGGSPSAGPPSDWCAARTNGAIARSPAGRGPARRSVVAQASGGRGRPRAQLQSGGDAPFPPWRALGRRRAVARRWRARRASSGDRFSLPRARVRHPGVRTALDTSRRARPIPVAAARGAVVRCHERAHRRWRWRRPSGAQGFSSATAWCGGHRGRCAGRRAAPPPQALARRGARRGAASRAARRRPRRQPRRAQRAASTAATTAASGGGRPRPRGPAVDGAPTEAGGDGGRCCPSDAATAVFRVRPGHCARARARNHRRGAPPPFRRVLRAPGRRCVRARPSPALGRRHTRGAGARGGQRGEPCRRDAPHRLRRRPHHAPPLDPDKVGGDGAPPHAHLAGAGGGIGRRRPPRPRSTAT